jgi:hypothetical protein
MRGGAEERLTLEEDIARARVQEPGEGAEGRGLARAVAAEESDDLSLAHLEGFIERLGTHGEMRTHIVLSTQFGELPGTGYDRLVAVVPWQ